MHFNLCDVDIICNGEAHQVWLYILFRDIQYILKGDVHQIVSSSVQIEHTFHG